MVWGAIYKKCHKGDSPLCVILYLCRKMAFFKCKNNDRFPAMVERQNWKGILNALGERFGNAHGVGNSAVITETKEYDAVRVEAEFHTSEISYDDHMENGRRIIATNDYRTFSDIPNHEALHNVQIILGGTLSTHTCAHCGGMGHMTCPMCGGSGHKMMDGHFEHCSRCGGRGNVSCGHCGGTGKYQTFKTVTVSDKTDFYSFCPVDAFGAMIRKQNIPTDVLYDDIYRSEELYSKIVERLGTEVKDAFQADFEKMHDAVKERPNGTLDDITVRAECSPIIEIRYKYRGKDYTLFISKQSPAVYCYSRFPGRLLQRIRELFSFGKDKESNSKTDRKLDRSYGSKYQK